MGRIHTQLGLYLTVAVLLCCTACGGGADRLQAPPEQEALLLPVPKGVDGALWAELTTELVRVLALHGASNATKPLSDPQFTVTDFALSARDGDFYTASWTYRNPGDYDQNGEVNSSDLVAMAKHYGKTSASLGWEVARLADGNGNGEVEIGDVSVLGQNYRNAVHGYLLMPEWGDMDHNGERHLADLGVFAPLGGFHRHDPVFVPRVQPGSGPVFVSPDDPDKTIMGGEHADPLDDLPGPWVTQNLAWVEEGSPPGGGGPRSYSVELRARSGVQLDFSGRRIIVAPFVRSGFGEFDRDVLVGKRSQILTVPALP